MLGEEMGEAPRFQQQHRKTAKRGISRGLQLALGCCTFRPEVDGRLCAAASAQDEQTFSGCSTQATPDGDIGRPWCYLAPQLIDASSDSKNW